MSFYIRRDTTFRIITTTAPDMHEILPPGNYVVQCDPLSGFFLEILPEFELPATRYGRNDAQAQRILTTFTQRPGTTGVLLTGEKGSGKSLLAKTIATEAVSQKIPTLIVNSSWRGDPFNSFLQSVTQPCIVLFDEFEKVYKSEEQKELLTLFDGVFSGKKLFVVTTNDLYQIHDHMRNRPGRFYYLLEFKGVEAEFIQEYCEAVLQDHAHLKTILQVASCYPHFNFDMLQALVEEMNRYQESPQEALAFLNIKPSKYDEREYAITLRIRGIVQETLSNAIWEGNPMALRGRINVEYFSTNSNGEESWEDAYFASGDLQSVTGNGTVYFKNSQGEELLLKPHVKPQPSYLSMLNGFHHALDF